MLSRGEQKASVRAQEIAMANFMEKATAQECGK